VRTLEENNFKITPDELKSAITSRTRAVIINSPNNPTGSVYSKSELEKLAEVASEEGIYIVSDEIYEKLNFEGEHASIATISPEIKKLTIVVNGFSKAYAMTGWRVGYAACEKSLALAMGNIQSHQTSNPNSIAQIAALEALSGDQSIISEMKAEYLKRMDYMTARINKIPGLSCLRPAGALYVFMNISKLFGKNHYGKIIDSSSEFCDNLLKISEVALVPSEGFGMDGYARLSFATSMGNIREGLDRIEKYVGGIE
jgi:aspartate aminotransferase